MSPSCRNGKVVDEYTRSHPDHLIVVTTLNSDGAILDISSFSPETRVGLVERGSEWEARLGLDGTSTVRRNSALRAEWRRRAAHAWWWRISLDGVLVVLEAPSPTPIGGGFQNEV